MEGTLQKVLITELGPAGAKEKKALVTTPAAAASLLSPNHRQAPHILQTAALLAGAFPRSLPVLALQQLLLQAVDATRMERNEISNK